MIADITITLPWWGWILGIIVAIIGLVGLGAVFMWGALVVTFLKTWK